LIRFTLAIPVLFLVVIGTFLMSKMVPGDPVLLHMNLDSERRGGASIDPETYRALYKRTAERYDLDLPWFYFSVKPYLLKSLSDHQLELIERKRLETMAVQFGNSELVLSFLKAHKVCFEELEKQLNLDPSIRRSLLTIDTTVSKTRIDQSIQFLAQTSIGVDAAFLEMQQAWTSIAENPPGLIAYFPTFFWHGSNNQFHNWFAKVVKGNFGLSFQDGRPVTNKLLNALAWTLPLGVLAWLLIIGLSVGIGVWTVKNRARYWTGWIEFVLLVINAVPLFWLSSLAVIYLTGAKPWQVFPSPGSMNHLLTTSTLEKTWNSFLFILLPLICIVINTLAVLSRQIKHLLSTELEKPYIKSAVVRGIPTQVIIWKYALPNALIPLTAYFDRIIPALVSGSVIIESIFNIPGIGSLMVQATLSRDWNVAFAVFMLGAMLTILGVFLSDYLLSKLSPISSKSLTQIK